MRTTDAPTPPAEEMDAIHRSWPQIEPGMKVSEFLDSLVGPCGYPDNYPDGYIVALYWGEHCGGWVVLPTDYCGDRDCDDLFVEPIAALHVCAQGISYVDSRHSEPVALSASEPVLPLLAAAARLDLADEREAGLESGIIGGCPYETEDCGGRCYCCMPPRGIPNGSVVPQDGRR